MLSVALAIALLQPLPDPRLAGASREERDGWIILHLAGSPRNVGYQHGVLLADEIAESRKTLAALLGEQGGHDWSWYRQTSKRLFRSKIDPEVRDELTGMAEGLRSKGRTEDFDDLLALNAHIEVSDYYEPWLRARERDTPPESKAPMACSAFVATGSSTLDGKVVMGHNFWWGYLMGERWRVILDIKPSSGHRFVMDALPGLIHSGTDWAINDAGMMLCETTISDFVGFDETGVPEFQRMRKAIQYGGDLDAMVRIFKEGNNGGYANTWLMADAHSGEIGKLELGLKNVTFQRKMDGYFVGSNFPENPKLIAEEAPGYRPQGNDCELRRQRWISLLDGSAGKVDVELGKQFLADTWDVRTQRNSGRGSALCGKGMFGGAVNAKVATADMALKLSFWARMGVPDGSRLAAKDMIRALPQIQVIADSLHDLEPNPWTFFAVP